MKPKIFMALTHDWELRGNGSGNIEQIQFEQMRRLLDLYARFSVRTSFAVETMQQLCFRKSSAQFPELAILADTWDECVREAFRRGHDIQLHVHPQWLDATYIDDRWNLTSDWSILNHLPAAAQEMIHAGKHYLENLLRPIDASYRCAVFRAGTLAVAPSRFLLGLLIDMGFALDVSLAGGLFLDTRNISLDYRECEEAFLPFYPDLTDARRVSNSAERIVCIPIHHFFLSRREVMRQQASRLWRRLQNRLDGGAADRYARDEWAQRDHSSIVKLVLDKLIVPYLHGKHVVSDTAQLTISQFREMLGSIRTQSRLVGHPAVPIVLTNHPKDMQGFSHLEAFLEEATVAEDIEFLTLTDLLQKLQCGEFPIRRRDS